MKDNALFKISEAASLAIHAMAVIAGGKGERHSAKDIAQELKVSEAHLSKVLQRLVKGGMIASTRGPAGGFKALRGADDIKLLEIFELIEGPLGSGACLLGTPRCGGGACVISGFIDESNGRIREFLTGTKLSQMNGMKLIKE